MPKSKQAVFPPPPVKNRDGSVTVYVVAETLAPDGVQYKPYLVHLRYGSNIAVPVNVPAKEVVSFENGDLVLTPNGLYVISKVLATASMVVARS